jgi:hypothetical protein
LIESAASFINTHLFLAAVFILLTLVGSASLIPVTWEPHPARIVATRSCAVLCLLAAPAVGLAKRF